MKIILVGYMGCGKSTIGKKLAEKLSIPFFDLDQIIEENESKSVKSIFEEHGEIYFRKKESQYFKNFALSTDNYVLALGGGTPCYADNVNVLKMDGIDSFYLKASVSLLLERLKKEKENRPLIAKLNDEEMEEYIRKHLFDRNYYYLQSKKTIAIDDKTIDEIVDEIVDEIMEKKIP